jgi:hypothetical protein
MTWWILDLLLRTFTKLGATYLWTLIICYQSCQYKFLQLQKYHLSRDSSQSSALNYFQHLALCQKCKNKTMNKQAQVTNNQRIKPQTYKKGYKTK